MADTATINLVCTDAALEGFWQAIDDAPGDLLPVAVLADYLYAHGDPRWEPLAWCRDNGKVPHDISGIFVWHPMGDRRSKSRASVPVRYLWVPVAHTRLTRFRGSLSWAYERLCDRWLQARAAGVDPLAD